MGFHCLGYILASQVLVASHADVSSLVHPVHTEADVSHADPVYRVDYWGRVDFPPVPAFDIDTHDPIKQDVYISGSVHAGTKPWDSFIWDRLVQLSKNNTLFVDVGANIGYFTLAMASLGHHVFAFEPMSRNTHKLIKSTLRNHFERRVTILQNAVSDTSGKMVFLKETDVTNQGNGQIVQQLAHIAGTYGVEYVHTLSLSDVLLFIPGHCIQTHILKIDVEGHEAAVIKGAESWLSSCMVKHVIMEFSESTRANKDFPANDMFRFMHKAGYTAHDVAVNPHRLLDMDRLVAGEFAHAPPNILFSRLV
jgi:FkbM family methyltransferase